MFKSLTVISAALLSLSCYASSPETEQLEYSLYSEINKKISYVAAPIKTAEDLYRVSSERSVLDLLSLDAKQRFIDSVVFSDGKIGGFRIVDLESELTPTDIYKVLSLIGYQHKTHRFTNARVVTELDALLLSVTPPTNNDYKIKALKPTSSFESSPEVGTMAAPGFLEGYKCESKGTCTIDTSSACTSNC